MVHPIDFYIQYLKSKHKDFNKADELLYETQVLQRRLYNKYTKLRYIFSWCRIKELNDRFDHRYKRRLIMRDVLLKLYWDDDDYSQY